MQPIIYNSLDTSAPQLTIAAGTLKTILKACLVTGYGDKPAAGWDIAWADDVANKIAFRSKNPTSIKSVLLVDDNAAASATVTAYNSWDSATNAGTGQFATGYFVKRWNTGFTPNWVVIATDKFFYLFIQTDSGSPRTRAMSAFGDTGSLRNDIYFSALICHTSWSYTQSNVCHSFIVTQLGTAKFPRTLFPSYVGAELWGDRSLNESYMSSTTLLSEFALYILVESKNQPLVKLPGMLMPYSQISGYGINASAELNMLTDQLPYANPVLGMYQPWQGRVWIHTDDWGQ